MSWRFPRAHLSNNLPGHSHLPGCPCCRGWQGDEGFPQVMKKKDIQSAALLCTCCFWWAGFSKKKMTLPKDNCSGKSSSLCFGTQYMRGMLGRHPPNEE